MTAGWDLLKVLDGDLPWSARRVSCYKAVGLYSMYWNVWTIGLLKFWNIGAGDGQAWTASPAPCAATDGDGRPRGGQPRPQDGGPVQHAFQEKACRRSRYLGKLFFKPFPTAKVVLICFQVIWIVFFFQVIWIVFYFQVICPRNACAVAKVVPGTWY